MSVKNSKRIYSIGANALAIIINQSSQTKRL